MAMDRIGNALFENRRPEEALRVFEASLAWKKRYWPHNEEIFLIAQANLASCLFDLGRHDEALILMRELYARRVAISGASHEYTIMAGFSLAISLERSGFFNDALTLLRDPLLPAARQTLGADHDQTLDIAKMIASIILDRPERTRDHLRLNRRRRAWPRLQATWRPAAGPRPDFGLDAGDDVLEAETIMQDVAQRRRRVFGPAHPDTLKAENVLSGVREILAGIKAAGT